jgi:hypothetical protein
MVAVLLMVVPDGVAAASALCVTTPSKAAPASTAMSLKVRLLFIDFILILLQGNKKSQKTGNKAMWKSGSTRPVTAQTDAQNDGGS